VKNQYQLFLTERFKVKGWFSFLDIDQEHVCNYPRNLIQQKMKQMKYQIETTIEIDASPAKVWRIFSNFKNYPKWNPFIASLTGEVKVGEIIHVDLNTMKFKPRVLKFDQNQELRWKGKLFIKGLFDGEHYFQLIANQNGTTTFIHGENFGGILVRLLRKKLDTEIKEGFQEMNMALKVEVEKAI